MATPPDPMADPPPTNPLTGRMDLPVSCNVCGKHWQPPDVPPCTHDSAELEAFFATQPPGPAQRQRWKPTGQPPAWETSPALESHRRFLNPFRKPPGFEPGRPPEPEQKPAETPAEK